MIQPEVILPSPNSALSCIHSNQNDFCHLTLEGSGEISDYPTLSL